MKITITFRQMEASDAVKEYAEEKIAKLQKFLRQAMTVQMTISVEGLDHIVDVQLSAGGTHFQCSERSENMYATIDLVHAKLERQIVAAKNTSVTRKRSGPSTREFAEAVLDAPAPPKSQPRKLGLNG